MQTVAYLSLELAFLHGAIVSEDLEGGAPFLQLHLPVQHHAGGHNNQVWAPDTCASDHIVITTVVCWLLSIAATCSNISGTDLHKQVHVLPQWDRSCRSTVLPHPVTVYWQLANLSQHWPYNTRCLALQPMQRQFLRHWYDSSWKNPHGASRNRTPHLLLSRQTKALTTRPTRQSVVITKFSHHQWTFSGKAQNTCEPHCHSVPQSHHHGWGKKCMTQMLYIILSMPVFHLKKNSDIL